MARSGATLAEIEAVYRRRGRDFYRFAFARTGDSAAAQDAVQEGFARAIRARETFRRESTLEAWVGRCVLNAARDAANSRAAIEPLAESVETASAADPPDADLRRADRALPTRQRDALFLRFYLDFDYAAIADTLGIEVGTVSATLHAARASLARALEEVTG